MTQVGSLIGVYAALAKINHPDTPNTQFYPTNDGLASPAYTCSIRIFTP